MKDDLLAGEQSKANLAGRCATALAEKYGQALRDGSENPLLQLGNPFISAAFETVRGIVEPSARRRVLRGAMAKNGVEVPLSSVKSGAVLLVGLAVVLEHSGVYLGEGKIAELHGSGEISQVSFEQFRVGRDSDVMKMRLGDRIYAACSLSENGKFEPLCDVKAAEVAQMFVQHSVSYNLLVNNCHLFTSTCVNHSQELIPSESLTTIEDLESCIARAHGIEAYNVFWLPINIPSTNELFAAKIRRATLNI